MRRVHPARRDLGPHWLKRAEQLTEGFGRVFTTNYDLLLYWVMMGRGRERFTDGFQRRDGPETRLVFNEHFREGSTQVLFLHGALHLHQTPTEVVKAEAAPDHTLRAVLHESLQGGVRPLFVSEGESRQKLSAIEGNPYLAFALEQLREGGGDLVTFGIGFSESDEHLLEAIAASPHYQRIFVGVHSPASGTVDRVRAKLAPWQEEVARRELTFYSTENVL
ncbi:MAG: DUF4917 family protein [Myxococcota bacterium]